MTRRRPPDQTAITSALANAPSAAGLVELGVAIGDSVRFRRRDNERWKPATVARREKDGSVGLHDGKGAARSIAIDLIEVRTTGPRGGIIWEPLSDRAATNECVVIVPEQLSEAATESLSDSIVSEQLTGASVMVEQLRLL